MFAIISNPIIGDVAYSYSVRTQDESDFKTSIPTALTYIKKIPPIFGEIPHRRRQGSNQGPLGPTNLKATMLLTELRGLLKSEGQNSI